MNNSSIATQSASPQTVANPTEAKALIRHMLDVMDALLGAVEEETELVRAGKLADAAKLEQIKGELTYAYLTDAAQIRASQPYLMKMVPDLVDELRERHNQFHAILQINLTVLATAHAVSEGIMRSASNELARKSTPQGYGASGVATAPAASSRRPLTLSRVL